MKQMVRLDRNDLRILDVLHKCGRLSNAQLAREVGLSESACFQRMKRLEQRQVITRLPGDGQYAVAWAVDHA